MIIEFSYSISNAKFHDRDTHESWFQAHTLFGREIGLVVHVITDSQRYKKEMGANNNMWDKSIEQKKNP